MTTVRRFLHTLRHLADEDKTLKGEETTPSDVLDALEWTESDTGDELVERAEKVEHGETVASRT